MSFDTVEVRSSSLLVPTISFALLTVMSNSSTPESQSAAQAQSTPETASQADESFGEMLSQYEKSHSRKGEDGGKQLVGTVIVVNADLVFLDIGFKSEGILPLTALKAGETVKPGDKFSVSVKGRDPEGYYQLTRAKVERPTDWAALEKAFAQLRSRADEAAIPRGGGRVSSRTRLFCR